MDGTYCINCGKKSPAPFKFCPDCGHEFGKTIGSAVYRKTTKESQTLRFSTKIWLLTFLLALIIGFFNIFGGDTPTAQQPPRQDSDESAIVLAKIYVNAGLKAPSTSKFSGIYVETAYDEKKGKTINVRGYVDAQNGFGAMLRKNFYCQFKPVSGKLELIDIEIF
jgi:hypothetical protein